VTAIVGLRQGRRTWIGCDAAITYGEETISAASPKVVRRCGVVWGAAGDARPCDAALDLDVAPWEVGLLSDWVRFALVPALDAAMARCDFTSTELLVGGGGQLVKVACGGAVIDDSAHVYAAIGSGEGPALGALFATERRGLSPRRRVMLALLAAAEHVGSVRGPMRVLSA
jgi:ATP-dependent protease HslVU (ClpYQ) peptidase subunit